MLTGPAAQMSNEPPGMLFVNELLIHWVKMIYQGAYREGCNDDNKHIY